MGSAMGGSAVIGAAWSGYQGAVGTSAIYFLSGLRPVTVAAPYC